ncbi:MAG: putative flippase GtrA [Arenicella sp.]|jgi:putative flippase GtrA
MIFKYLLVGGTAAAVDISIFVAFGYYLGFNYLIVGAIGFIIATAVNYFLCIKFVFQANVRFNRKQEISAVYVVSATGLVFHEAILALSVEKFLLPIILAKLIATGSVFFWNYVSRKYFVFKAKDSLEIN